MILLHRERVEQTGLKLFGNGDYYHWTWRIFHSKNPISYPVTMMHLIFLCDIVRIFLRYEQCTIKKTAILSGTSENLNAYIIRFNNTQTKARKRNEKEPDLILVIKEVTHIITVRLFCDVS